MNHPPGHPPGGSGGPFPPPDYPPQPQSGNLQHSQGGYPPQYPPQPQGGYPPQQQGGYPQQGGYAQAGPYAPPMHAGGYAPGAPVEAPGLARVAGMVWVGTGALGILGGVLVLVIGGAFGLVAAVLMTLFSAVFVMVGVQTIRGTAPDTLGNGIGSILFGAFGLYSAVSTGGILALLLSGMQGLALIAAGAMVLSIRAPYKAWHLYLKQSQQR